MSLKERIEVDMRAALKAGDGERLGTLRLLLAAIKNAEIEKREELSDEDVVRVVAREVKKWEEAAAEYKRVGRAAQASREEAEADILRVYLPPQLSEEEIRDIVRETIAEVGALSLKDMGRVMGAIMPKVRGRADGKLVNEIVKELLA
ncbi:MAG: GatB/YqeY domain-containing protein [Actinomycetota bacterium]|nr:GatB/YqeY domain-containing protein [Actinomycetota bacterium]